MRRDALGTRNGDTRVIRCDSVGRPGAGRRLGGKLSRVERVGCRRGELVVCSAAALGRVGECLREGVAEAEW